MRIKKAVITFSIPEVQEILRIAMDNDEQEALRFLKNVLSKRVKEAIQTH